MFSLLCFLLSFAGGGDSLLAQRLVEGYIIATVSPEAGLHVNADSTFHFERPELNALMEEYGVEKIVWSFPTFRETPRAGLEDYAQTCELFLEEKENELCMALQSSPYFKKPMRDTYIEIELTGDACHTPSDYDQYNGVTELNRIPAEHWHLDMIRAKEAWSLTKGRSALKIAIMDVDFIPSGGVMHSDLVGMTFDPNMTAASPQSYGYHGVKVAGTASANTNNGTVGLSSIGYNTSLMGFDIAGTVHRFTQDLPLVGGNGCDVLNCSFLFPSIHSGDVGTQVPTYNAQTLQAFIDAYIPESGLIIVAGAGNGNAPGASRLEGREYSNSWNLPPPPPSTYPTNVVSSPENGYAFPASFDNVISVSSVNQLEGYEGLPSYYLTPNLQCAQCGDNMHSYNDRVDLTAPGYQVPVLNASSTNPIGRATGTSFASPIVAGTASLMRSVNPFISPQATRDVLRCTAEDISLRVPPITRPGGQDYVGNLYLTPWAGSGRLDAYEAVRHAAAAVFDDDDEHCESPLEYICPDDEEVKTLHLNRHPTYLNPLTISPLIRDAINWRVSPHFELVNSTPTSVSFRVINPDAECKPFIEADVYFESHPTYPYENINGERIRVRKDIYLLCDTQPENLLSDPGNRELCEDVLRPTLRFFTPHVGGATGYEWQISPAPLASAQLDGRFIGTQPELTLNGSDFAPGTYQIRTRAVREHRCAGCEGNTVQTYTKWVYSDFFVKPKVECNPDCQLILDANLLDLNTLSVGIKDGETGEVPNLPYRISIYSQKGETLAQAEGYGENPATFDLQDLQNWNPCCCVDSDTINNSHPDCPCPKDNSCFGGGGYDGDDNEDQEGDIIIIIGDLIGGLDPIDTTTHDLCITGQQLTLPPVSGQQNGSYLFHASPNPASDFIDLWLEDPATGEPLEMNYSVSLQDIYQSQHLTGQRSEQPSEVRGVRFDVSTLPRGVYYARATLSDEESYTLKLILE